MDSTYPPRLPSHSPSTSTSTSTSPSSPAAQHCHNIFFSVEQNFHRGSSSFNPRYSSRTCKRSHSRAGNSEQLPQVINNSFLFRYCNNQLPQVINSKHLSYLGMIFREKVVELGLSIFFYNKIYSLVMKLLFSFSLSKHSMFLHPKKKHLHSTLLVYVCMHAWIIEEIE